MFRVLLERAAEKDLRKLSPDIHDRIIAAIRGLAANPRPPGCRKLGASRHCDDRTAGLLPLLLRGGEGRGEEAL